MNVQNRVSDLVPQELTTDLDLGVDNDLQKFADDIKLYGVVTNRDAKRLERSHTVDITLANEVQRSKMFSHASWKFKYRPTVHLCH